MDRETGLYGVFGTYVLPPADPEVEKVIKGWETRLYQLLTARSDE